MLVNLHFLDSSFFNCRSKEDIHLSLPSVSPSTLMYIIFTSGSTGKPKGVIISYENFTSGALPRAECRWTLGCFDFPAYALNLRIQGQCLEPFRP